MLDKQYPTVHSGGINKDRYFQDKNDVTFALNAIRTNHEGGRIEYQSEPGNEISVGLPSGYLIAGSIYGQDEEIYVFSTNSINSEIGIFKNDKYTTLVNSDCLGFNLEHPITGEYRVRNGCERTIYWCDHFNSDYWYNIDDPESFKTGGQFDCNKFKHVPVLLPIKTDLVSVNDSGGILPLGSYYFQPEYLDENQNLIYSGDITPQVIIYDESQNIDYFKIDGGLNIEQYDPAIGGVPLTNKSITLRFYNLNTSIRYLKVNVFRAINGSQVIDGHSVATLIEVSSESIDWTYQGYNVSAGDSPIDASEKLVNNITYESAYVSEQVQGRYLRANLKQSVRDYSTYQSFVSKITCKWVAKTIEMNNVKYLGNPKNPQTYWTSRGFQGDEVYLPGIQFLHDSGQWSPVFPTVGRSANSTDLEILTVVPNNATLGPLDVWLSDVEHLGLDINAQVPRWKVFNTATITSSQTAVLPKTYEGEFSYYESDETYPDVRDCDNNLLWGEDADSNPITTSTKVRLVKFPDRRLVNHVDGDWALPFGIKFDNITYPDSSVIGHRFVFADRTEFDKTVVDSGWAVTPFSRTGTDQIILGRGQTGGPDDNYKHFNYSPSNPQSKHIRFNSAKTLFDKSVSNISYYKTNRVNKFESGTAGTNAPFDYARVELDNGFRLYSIISRLFWTDDALPTRTNHTEQQTVLVEPGSTVAAQGLLPTIICQDTYTGDSVSYVNYGLEDTTPLLGAQVFDWVRNGTRTEFKFHNFYAYKKTLAQPYTNFLTRIYKTINHNYVSSTNTNDNEFYGGDTLISPATTFRLSPLELNDENDSYAYTMMYRHHYEEHDINSALRHLGVANTSKYFQLNDQDSYNFDRLTFLDDSGNRQRVDYENVIPEYYAYNPDFTLKSYEKAKVSLPIQYNYCSGCSGSYPNRIAFSPKSFDEEAFDLYRINKVNDYIDIPAHRGAITGLKYQNNQLLVHTEDTTFILQPNPQQISTDQNTAYLTTGDFLSIPPQELLQTDTGTGGLQSKQSMCNTPFGHCWVDQKRGEIFNWNGKIDMLSNDGLLQWCKEHLPSELNKEYYRVYNENFPINSTLTLNGIGVILYYDPRFKRLLITKRDYLPLDLRTSLVPGDSNATIYNGTNWQSQPESIINVFPTDSQYFENKSWTLSYSFLDQGWTSWHSYIPWYGFSDSNNFYTTILNNNIWKHLSKTKYQNYYTAKYNFIVEWMNSDPVTNTVSNLHYVGYSQIWDAVNKQFKTVDTTFDKIMVYNFEQSSGLQNLILDTQHGTNPYGNNSLLGNSKYVIKTDQNYKIAGLYDMATNYPVVTKDWELKKLFPGYIDIVSNDPNINFNKNQYDWGNIWDKFVFVRLFYKPTADHRKSIILQVLNNHQSVR